ncbi:hypothetical protein [Halanaerobacter jeridensis]|uniref:Uncharacterized protein n=1 Tax=Halanaerobacter jeridensis TaxID=706427 RepID=A0A939BSA7_9FIRM|nr:hypothetical protein [Halanaerobacter jeridensis]MBM7558159.1 hypothetical protein [Halanaerobacter jeridensis]
MNYYGKRYMPAEKFRKYYYEVAETRAINGAHKRDISELEFWEEEELFYPYIRVILPAEIPRFFEEQRLGVEKQQDIPKSWQKNWKGIIDFLKKVDYWKDKISFVKGENYNKDSIIHPYDINNGFNEFILNPREKEFKPWDSYEFKVWAEENGKRYYTPKSCAEHLYHYWQIHYLDAVRRENRIGFYVSKDLFSSEEDLINKDNKLKIKQPFYYTKLEDLNSVKESYDMLSQYILEQNREFEYLVRNQNKDTGYKLSEEKYKIYYDRCEKNANRIYHKYNLTQSEIFDFLKTLCNLYFDYEKDRREKLSKEVKKDISKLVDLIIYVTEMSVDNIINEIGKLHGCKKNALNIIFPDLLEEAKEDAFKTIKSNLRDYNSKVLEKYKLEKKDIIDLCDYCSKNGHSLLLQTINQLNHDWFNRNAFTNDKLFTHTRNLSIFVEDFIKYIGNHCLNNDIRNKFNQARAGKLTFENCLKWLVNFNNQAPWWGKFKSEKKTVTSVKPQDGDKVLKQVVNQQKFHKKEWMNFVIKNFIITNVIRNLAAHTVRCPKKVFEVYYVNIFNSIINSVLFIWGFALENNLVKIDD